MSPDERALRELEAVAQRLKADGYTRAVVARKMISQHGMPEPEAVALVSRLYGKPADPRLGDTTAALVTGGLLILGGLVGLVVLFGVLDLRFGRSYLVLGGLLVSAIGLGFKKVIFALVNANAKEDLR